MRNSRFAFCLLAILCIIGCGQQLLTAQNSGYVKTYFFEERSTSFYAIRNYGDDIVVAGPMGTDSFGNSGIVLARIDSTGYVKNLFLFYDPGDTYDLFILNVLYEALTVTENGEIVVAGSTNRVHDLFQIIIQSDFENIAFHTYESQFPKDRYVNHNLEFNSAIYTVGHAKAETGSFEMFIHKSNLIGDEIWEKKYGVSTDYDYATSIVPKANNLIVLANSRGDNNSDPNTAYTITKIFEVDTSGQVISSWQSQINEEGLSAEGLLKLADKYYYITHPRIVDDIGNVHYYPQLVCRDLEYNLVWREDYGEPNFMSHFNDIAVGPDEYLFAAGYIPVDGITWGRVCKIDPEDGEIIWEARDTAFVIPGWGSRNRMEGIAVLPSGSVIAAGYTMDPTFHEQGLLYKITADGCIDTLCTTVSIEDLLNNPDERVVVYPNPASEMISFDLPDSEEAYIVEVYSLDGILLHHETLSQTQNAIYLDHSDYSQGLYIWQVKSHTGKIVDTGKVMIVDK